MEHNLAVWWLSQADFSVFTPLDFEHFPAWLNDQLRSAKGRNGRGRLWIAPQFPQDFEVKFDNSPLALSCSQCAGIVIYCSSTGLLAHLPGIVTDQTLRRVL